MFDMAKTVAAMRALWAEMVGPEPDVPIPPELQPPKDWSFDLKRIRRNPLSVTVWDALHAEEELWLMQELQIFTSSTTDGYELARIVAIWHNSSTPEDIGLMVSVRHARTRNMLWRTHMDVRRRHLVIGQDVEGLVPSGR